MGPLDLHLLIWVAGISVEAWIVYTALIRKQATSYLPFFCYIVAVLVADIMLFFFYTRYTYAVKELILATLKIAVSLWLMRKLLVDYVGLQLTLTGSYFIIIISLVALALVQPLRSGGWWPAFVDLHNRIQVSIFLMFMVLAAAIYYYNLRIERAVKYILIGFLLYLSTFTVDYAIWLQFNLGERARIVTNYIDSAAYVASLIIWTRVYARSQVRFFEPGRATQPAWRKS